MPENINRLVKITNSTLTRYNGKEAKVFMENKDFEYFIVFMQPNIYLQVNAPYSSNPQCEFIPVEEKKLPPAIQGLAEKIQEKGYKVQFGLEQQGHIPTIEKMLAESGSNKWTWDAIANKIGWDALTACSWYLDYVRNKSERTEKIHKDDNNVLEIKIENVSNKVRNVSLFKGFSVMDIKNFNDNGDFMSNDGIKISCATNGLRYIDVIAKSMNNPYKIFFTTPEFPAKRNKKLDRPCEVYQTDWIRGLTHMLPLIGVYDPWRDQSVIGNEYYIDGFTEFKVYNVPKKATVTIFLHYKR